MDPPDTPGLVTKKNKPGEHPPPTTWKNIRDQVDAMGFLEEFLRNL